MPRDLTDQVIAITGASSGIGAATAIACAQAGMHVAINARRQDRLEAVARRITPSGRQALVIGGDVDRDDDVDRFIDQTQTHFGRLDAVFANAGYGLYASVDATGDAQARAIFETNFFGTLRVIRKAVPIMRDQGRGHILICSSAVSEIGLPMYGMYCATKAAQDSVASAMRAELIDQGINVSSVHPVGTSTEFYESTRIRSNESQSRYNTPAALVQTSEQVARSIVRCLRKPRPEVWPQPWARIGLAIVTAAPTFNASSMRSLMRKRFAKAIDKGTES